MVISKSNGNTSTVGKERPVLEFCNSKKVRGIPYKHFSLVITAIIANFDVFRILIDGGNSCDIIYANLFEKIGLEKGKL